MLVGKYGLAKYVKKRKKVVKFTFDCLSNVVLLMIRCHRTCGGERFLEGEGS